MKKGDKVYCKKSYKDYFSINKFYIVKKIYENEVTIYFGFNGWTTFTIDVDHYEWGKFEDYFYTEKEVRKLKLETLNNKL